MKRLLAILLMFGSVCVTRADYLYWQVSGISPSTYQNQYATLSVTDNGTKVTLMTAPTGSDVYMANVGGYSLSSSFLIEYLNYDSVTHQVTSLGDSGSQLYSDLVSRGAIVPDTGLIYEQSSVWHGGNSYSFLSAVAIPEPTSGLLLALGLALLNLKRRRS